MVYIHAVSGKGGHTMEDKDILLALGNNLKKVRLSKGLSQEKLAFEADLDRTYISGIERGKRNVSVVNLYRIANALGIPPHLLLQLGLEGTDGEEVS